MYPGLGRGHTDKRSNGQRPTAKCRLLLWCLFTSHAPKWPYRH